MEGFPNPVTNILAVLGFMMTHVLILLSNLLLSFDIHTYSSEQNIVNISYL